MCGRYTVRSIQPVAELFGISLPPEFRPRFNIAPTQDVLIIRAAGRTPESENPDRPARRGDLLRWGLVPFWAKDPSVGNKMINARAETAADRPAFRDAMRRRRCLVPADGFYEWRVVEGSRRKQPHLIHMRDHSPFAFAGVWDSWGRGDDRLETFTILTTSPNELVSRIHDRMPVIVPRNDYGRWLDPLVPSQAVADVLRPYPAEEMTEQAVGTRVNSPSNDDPSCAEAWE